MEDNKQIKQIDFVKIWKALVRNKKIFFYTLPISIVISSLLIICVPRYYTCNVELAPEINSLNSSSIKDLASSFGFDVGSKMDSYDAISPELYPNLVQSVDFRVSLFSIKVKSKDGKINEQYYDYLNKNQKTAWWDKVLGTIKNLFKKKDNANNSIKNVNSFMLTKQQYDIADLINKKVKCSVDKKTNVISISVKDQDPLICATLADSVSRRLQYFITDYRTKKARNDLDFTRKLYNNAKEDYEKARQTYGSYSDANTEVVLQSYRLKQEDLENEMQLRYNTYTSLATQFQSAKAKVQEQTPAFTTLQSATVPIKPSGPKRMIFVLIIFILTFICTALFASRKEFTA